MSAPEAPGPPDPVRHQFDIGSALLILAGVVLLLPGVCAIYSAFDMSATISINPSVLIPLALLWAFCLAIGYGGIKLIKRGWGM